MKRLVRLGLVPLALAFACGLAAAGPYYTGLKVYIGQKNYEKAASIGEQALEQDGNNADVYNKYAIALAELDSLDHAGELFSQGLDLATKNNDEKTKKDIETNMQHYYAHFYQAGSLDLTDATGVLDSIGSHADTTKASYKTAMAGANAKFAKSVVELQKARSIKPKDPRVWLQLGVAYSSMGDEVHGIECYKKALDLDPGYQPARDNLRGARIRAAEKFKAAGKWKDAADVFAGLVQEGDTASLQDLGDVYYNMAKAAPASDTAAANSGYRKSASYYGEFYDAHPADTIAEYNYVVALMNAKDWPTAQKITKRIVARNPMIPASHSLLRDTFAGGGSGVAATMGEKLAEDALSKGKEVAPTALKPAAVSDAGKLIAKSGRPEKAYTWVQDTFQCSAYFYLARGRVYGFIADKQVGESSWLP